MARRSFMALAIFCCTLSGCDERIVADVSGKPEYKALVGSRYEIIADLVAYGIKRERHQKAEYVTLIPPPWIAGSEVDFAIPVKRGSEVTILKIVKTNRWPDPDLTLLVRMTGMQPPIEQPVKIDLFRGNESSAGALLNPKIYRRIAP